MPAASCTAATGANPNYSLCCIRQTSKLMSRVNACSLNLALGGMLTAEVWSCGSKQTHASKNDKGAQMQATITGRMAQRTLSQPEKKLKLTVNSQERSVVAAADTPLLYVLRDQLELTGPDRKSVV